MADVLGDPGYEAAMADAGAELARLPALDIAGLRDGMGGMDGT